MGIKNAVDVYEHVRDTSPSEQAILAGIALWAKDKPPRITWHSYGAIVEKTRFCRNTVLGAVSRLEILGHIRVKSGGIDKYGVKKANTYTYIRQKDVQQTNSPVDKSVDNPVDNSADGSAPPQQVVNELDFGSAAVGQGVVQQVDSKRKIKRKEKERDEGAGGGTVGSPIAIKGWEDREITPEMEQRIFALELKRVVKGLRRPSCGAEARPKSPVRLAASACGMGRFTDDQARAFREIMFQRDLNEGLKVIEQFDNDRKAGKLKQCICLPIELMARLSQLPKLR